MHRFNSFIQNHCVRSCGHYFGCHLFFCVQCNPDCIGSIGNSIIISFLFFLSIPLILWLYVYINLFFLMFTIISLPFFIRRKNLIFFLGIHFWILSTVCPDGHHSYFHEAGAVGPNVARLSTFVACDIHAITFPFGCCGRGFCQ